MASKVQVKRVPLVYATGSRAEVQNLWETNAKDSHFKNCIIKGEKRPEGDFAWVEKRQGVVTNDTFNSYTTAHAGFISASADIYIQHGTSIKLNDTYTLLSLANDTPGIFSEGSSTGATTPIVFFYHKHDGLFYYDESLRPDQGSTFTGTTTIGNSHITGITSTGSWHTVNLQVGQLITAGAGIPAGTRIKEIISSTEIVMGTDDETEVVATATGSRTVTYEFFQKVMDASIPGYNYDTDGNFLTNILWKDGFIFFLDKYGRLFNSDYNNYQNVNQLDYLATTEVADSAYGLINVGGLIGVVGSRAIEFYQNVGNPQGSVLKRVRERTVLFNHIGGPQYWDTMDGATYFLNGNNYSISRLKHGSNQIEVLTDAPTARRIRMGRNWTHLKCIKIDGMIYLMLTKDNDGGNAGEWGYALYQPDLKILTEGQFYTGNLMPLLTTGADNTMYFWVSSNEWPTGETPKGGAGFYFWTKNDGSMVWQDAGNAFEMYVQTPRIDFGTQNYKRIRRLTLIGDEEEATSTTSISWSDDDYQTFNTPRTVDMSAGRGTLTELGALRRPAFKISNSANTPCRWYGLEVEFEILDR